MQIWVVLIRKYIALRDFWHASIRTYTYIDLYHTIGNKKHHSYNKTTIQDNHTNTTTQTHSMDTFHAIPLDNNTQSLVCDSNLNVLPSQTKQALTPLDTTSELLYTYNIEYQPYMHYSYITLQQYYTKETKAHRLAQLLYHIPSTHYYYGVLPLDYLISTQINIEKQQLQQNNVFDSIVPLHAQNQGLIPHNYEYRYFLQHQTPTHFTFQIFCVAQTILQDYATKYAGKILYLNPLELCCGLYDFYPTLQHYTIIFQDKHKHALCHYSNGMLAVSVILERNEALQNHYGLIQDFGTIFYCDFSGKPDLLCDFTDITTLFNMSLHDCFHILALHHIRTKPAYINFYPQTFYNMRSRLKMLISCILCVFIVYFGYFYYNKYQYYQFLEHEENKYHTQIEYLYHKKQQYPFMYERIYKQLLEQQSFQFCLQQDYGKTQQGFTWIQSLCTQSK